MGYGLIPEGFDLGGITGGLLLLPISLIPSFSWDIEESDGRRGGSGKNRTTAAVSISLRIRRGDFYRRANHQISRPATAGLGIRWSSGSCGSPSTRFGRSLAACWATTC